jgi:hypothetical protein
MEELSFHRETGSIVALRVAGCDEKDPSALGYNWATFFGEMDINAGI